ncbi:MAG: signal peptide peptidase SppA [Dissulfurimicrobium sp.]|uniref:signal peptide peptidase SppA n=1 Tax=Dissulfurimicrobium sp. TaxID=2022436 RepID=UPI003D0F74DE
MDFGMEGERPIQTTGGLRNTLLVVLATIGGLAILSMVGFVLLIFWLVRPGVTVPAVGSGEKIGVVEIKGVITESEPTLKLLRELGARPDIKAVVVRIDSPGGAVGASQEIYEEIKRLDKKKPVVASLATVAASGGYYVAVGARRIIANPGTITGSIGVIMKLPNLGPLMEKLGIKLNVVQSGALKDLGPINRDPSPKEVKVISSVMDDIHKQFIAAVAEGRGLTIEQVEPLADGRIFSGNQALQYKLVDKLGNFSVAAQEAARLAGIKGEPKLEYPAKDRLSILREMFEETGARALSGVIQRFFISIEPIPLYSIGMPNGQR